MAFTIPNAASAFHRHQAEPDSVDIDILVAGYARTGVVSGCAVTAQVSPDMTCAVASGSVQVAGVPATVASGNVTITAADGTNPRIDLVVVNSSGTKSVTAGTAAAEPVMPAIPANSLVLAAVYVPASDTTIASNQITDKRVLFSDLAFLPSHARVETDQTSASDTFGDLATVGPSVTLTTSTIVKVTLGAYIWNNTLNSGGYMALDISGATTRAADFTYSVMWDGSTASRGAALSNTFIVSGLTAGSNTLKAVYKRASGGTAHFQYRQIIVEPF